MRHERRGPAARTFLAVTALLAVIVFLPAIGAQAAEERPERIAGKPNLNGIWQAMNAAHWNLEPHSARALDRFWRLGALGAVPAGQGVVVGGEIPYRPDARRQREENRAQWPEADPVAKCYMPGIPRANYMPFPFRIVQGEGDILFAYSFAKSNRVVHMGEPQDAPIDQWMGISNGRWEGDTLVVEVIGNDGRTWLDRSGNHHSGRMTVTERFTLIDDSHIRYEATIEDPETFTRPWTIRMPLYRRVEPNAELLEYNCVPFAEELLYGHLEKEPQRDGED